MHTGIGGNYVFFLFSAQKTPQEVGGSTKLHKERSDSIFVRNCYLCTYFNFANSDHILSWMDTDSFMVCD